MAEELDIAAILAAAIAACVSLVSIYLTKRNDTKLEMLRNSLEIKKDEEAARRDYEFGARKRLYNKCEPLLFQLGELSESALLRIYALAKNARQGNLGPGSRLYLSHDHYFIRSTIYRLLAPMAIFKLLQNQLTMIDLQLVPIMNIQYDLAKILYYSFSSAKELADSNPSINYDPDFIKIDPAISDNDKKEKLKIHPEEYWLQGLKVGTLDNLMSDTFIHYGDTQNIRVKSFGEFETQFFDNDSWKNLFKRQILDIDNLNIKDSTYLFEPVFTLFANNEGFHPRTRPVLWRILITQVYLYQALIQIRKDPDLLFTSFDEFKERLRIDEDNLDWRKSDEDISTEELRQPFLASENYLKERLTTVFEMCQKVKNRKMSKDKNRLSTINNISV